jgi:hypothetical protein
MVLRERNGYVGRLLRNRSSLVTTLYIQPRCLSIPNCHITRRGDGMGSLHESMFKVICLVGDCYLRGAIYDPAEESSPAPLCHAYNMESYNTNLLTEAVSVFFIKYLA